MKPKNKAMLIVLDGWGLRKESKDNPIEVARTIYGMTR